MKLTTIDLLSDSNILRDSQKLQSVIECKFVLLSKKTEHFLLFGPLNVYNYHAHLVEKFCIDQNINSEWKKQPDQFKILDDSLIINGGGWFQIDCSHNKLTALSISTAYGRFDEQILRKFIEKNQVLKLLRRWKKHPLGNKTKRNNPPHPQTKS